MGKLRSSNPRLADVIPYDPKYLPADAMMSANENPEDVPAAVRAEIEAAISKINLNRYPDPLANELRDEIAKAWGLTRECVLLGNGGDELLFDMALTWGGEGRTYLDVPPTFSVYANNARITGTRVVTVPRKDDFTVDEEALIERASQGDIDYTIVCSPNNPSGDLVSIDFVERLLNATDALVMIDEAYYEFSRETVVSLLEKHENLVILHTFSKAYSLAGVRMGYILANPSVITEFIKVRQPYSVDAVSQAIALAVWKARDSFTPGIDAIIAQREQVAEELSSIDGVTVFPSRSNYIMFRVEGIDGGTVWQKLYDRSILVRDFSAGARTQGCMRVSIGSAQENQAFLEALRDIMKEVQ